MAASRAAGTGQGLFRHPRLVWYFAATELWDRISFQGMQAILTLYLAEQLLLPGRAAHVILLGPFRGAVEAVTGPLSTDALATQTFGIYLSLVFASPLLGGWLGDRFLTRRSAVIAGALAMTLGHFCLAFDASFLFGLLFLAAGTGLFRANLSPQLVSLYPPGDRRLPEAFQIYNFAVTVGGTLAPILIGALATFYSWHVGFGAAGLGMLIGLLIYVSAPHADLPPDIKPTRAERPPLTGEQRRSFILMLALWPALVSFWVAQSQIWNTYNLWVRDHVDMNLGAFTIPVPWMQSVDSGVNIVMTPLLLWWWVTLDRQGREPGLVTKLGIGCLIFAAATTILAFASPAPGSAAKIALLFPLSFHLVSNIGWIWFAPTAAALLISRAPKRMRGVMYGINYLSISVATLISGRLGALYESWSPRDFWLLHAAIPATGGVAILAASRFLTRNLPPVADEGPPPPVSDLEPV
jgi:POT family proton-dependent oligopeptide transporter